MVSALMVALFCLTPSLARAQRPDTAAVARRVPSVIIRGPAGDSVVVPDTVPIIRISPRRAFLTSLAAPSYMQFKFGRPKAAAIFLAVEAGGIGMAIKSKRDLNVAKAAKLDSIFTPVLDSVGKPVIDSVTGKPSHTSALRNKNIADRVSARRTHFEDWVAALVFNHLFAGADAFVAANLADFDTNVRVTSTDHGLRILASVAW
jgi:hypothetical protein